MDIPTWEEARQAVEAEAATPLGAFIYEFEVEHDSKVFREKLQAVINQVIEKHTRTPLYAQGLMANARVINQNERE